MKNDRPELISASSLKERIGQLSDDSGSGYEAGWYDALDVVIKIIDEMAEKCRSDGGEK